MGFYCFGSYSIKYSCGQLKGHSLLAVRGSGVTVYHIILFFRYFCIALI